MADVPPPPPPTDGEGDVPPKEPEGAVRLLWFDGILDAPRPGDTERLRKGVARMNSSGLGRVDLSVDGGQFSLLMEEAVTPGDRVNEAGRDELRAGLEEVIAQVPEGGVVESALRCTEVFPEETRETLFTVTGGQLRMLARLRPVSAQDMDRDPARQRIVPPIAIGRRALLLIAVLFLVGLGLTAWRAGYLDRAFGAGAEDLEQNAGAFEDLLKMEVESSWGKLLVKIRRGERYPKDPAAAKALVDAATSSADRAAVNAVADGDSIWIRLEDADGKVLAAVETDLRALVTAEDGEVEVKLSSMISAQTLRLALDKGKK